MITNFFLFFTHLVGRFRLRHVGSDGGAVIALLLVQETGRHHGRLLLGNPRRQLLLREQEAQQ